MKNTKNMLQKQVFLLDWVRWNYRNCSPAIVVNFDIFYRNMAMSLLYKIYTFSGEIVPQGHLRLRQKTSCIVTLFYIRKTGQCFFVSSPYYFKKDRTMPCNDRFFNPLLLNWYKISMLCYHKIGSWTFTNYLIWYNLWKKKLCFILSICKIGQWLSNRQVWFNFSNNFLIQI